MDRNQRIRIALQKSGRLSEDSFDLLERAGITIRKQSQQLFRHSPNFALDVLLVRDDDIPNLVASGQCDYGIVGSNVLDELCLEQDLTIERIQALDFGSCKLVLAVPEHFSADHLNHLRIATSYPNLLKKFLDQNQIKAEIIVLQGSVEIAPRLGIADAICDLVATGTTLEANHLKLFTTIYQSQAYLIKNPTIITVKKQFIAESFEKRIQSVLQARESKYIMLHAERKNLASIVALLPGAEHPTILSLEGSNEKIAIHAVCRETIFWETLEQLKQVGASSILVLPIEKMMR